jgi:hypothetical protein
MAAIIFHTVSISAAENPRVLNAEFVALWSDPSLMVLTLDDFPC